MTPRTRWHSSIDLGYVFHDNDLSFTERRDTIVQRISTASFYDADDLQLADIVYELSQAEDAEEFDFLWDEFYDWADVNGVWVTTL